MNNEVEKLIGFGVIVLFGLTRVVWPPFISEGFASITSLTASDRVTTFELC